MKLELVESVTLARPFVKGFDQVAYCLSDEEVRLVARGGTTEAVAKRKAKDVEGVRPAYSTTFYVGIGMKAKQRPWIRKYRDQTCCSWFHFR
jgi:poly(A) polymerase